MGWDEGLSVADHFHRAVDPDRTTMWGTLI